MGSNVEEGDSHGVKWHKAGRLPTERSGADLWDSGFLVRSTEGYSFKSRSKGLFRGDGPGNRCPVKASHLLPTHPR